MELLCEQYSTIFRRYSILRTALCARCRLRTPCYSSNEENFMNNVILFDPTAPRQQADGGAARTLSGLKGAVVGFIDNAKPNFNHLVDDLGDLLVARYGVARVMKRRKRSASVPVPEDMLREITGECDLVIAGSGD